MSNTVHFISGLPRSGSTLLANLLAQNPRFHSTATSGILEILFQVRNNWDKVAEFRAAPDQVENEGSKLRVLRGILSSFHSEHRRPIVFDKSRGWLSHLEMAEKILGRPVRVLVPVRDVREVLCSFELLWRGASSISQIAQESANYVDFQTVEGRCETWLRKDQPVGLAINRIRDAYLRGFADRLLLIRFDELTQDPLAAMHEIYEFLDEEYFEHDFNNVQQVTSEDDRVFGFKDLHTIRPNITPVPIRWPKVLGPAGQKYEKFNSFSFGADGQSP